MTVGVLRPRDLARFAGLYSVVVLVGVARLDHILRHNLFEIPSCTIVGFMCPGDDCTCASHTVVAVVVVVVVGVCA